MEPSRLYYMDLLRGVLMLLGVVLHTLAVFSIDSTWKISSSEKAIYADALVSIIHSFRMPAFFIISGFFTALILARRNRYDYVKMRMTRLGIPLLFTGLLINIPMSLYVNGGPGDVGWSNYLGRASWLGHLWFLSVLILYSVMAGVLWPLIAKWLNSDKASINLLFIFLIVLSYPIVIRIGWQLDVRDMYLFILPRSNLFQYLPYFIIGIIFFFQKDRINLDKGLLPILALTAISITLFLLISMPVINNLLEILSSLLISFSIFAIANRMLTEYPRKWIRQLADASYTIYIIHQPVIIALGFVVLQLSMNVHLKVITILALTTLITLLVHVYIVKKFRLAGILLNGNSTIKKS